MSEYGANANVSRLSKFQKDATLVEIPFNKDGYGECVVKGLVVGRHIREGVYPMILGGLFNMRKVVKKQMEETAEQLEHVTD